MTKVLLVEDDKSLREIYGVRLLAEGYDIVSAGDGEEALAMAIKEKPTLIISDVMMPKISGFDMLDILRSTTETRNIKVIMMTALSSEDQRTRGEQLGADRYLVKSQVGIEDVVRTVHEVLGDIPGAAASSAAPATSAPAEPATDDAAKSDEDSVAVTSTAPGNGAGPLPLQPTELTAPTPVIEPVEPPVPTPAEPESTLPQPTAPFSSTRPTNLGEQVVHPETTIEPPAEPAAEPETPATPEPTPAVEPLNNLASPDPASSVEPAPESTVEPLAPAEPVVTPAPEPPAEPAEPETPAVSPETPAPEVPPAATPPTPAV